MTYGSMKVGILHRMELNQEKIKRNLYLQLFHDWKDSNKLHTFFGNKVFGNWLFEKSNWWDFNLSGGQKHFGENTHQSRRAAFFRNMLNKLKSVLDNSETKVPIGPGRQQKMFPLTNNSIAILPRGESRNWVALFYEVSTRNIHVFFVSVDRSSFDHCYK